MRVNKSCDVWPYSVSRVIIPTLPTHVQFGFNSGLTKFTAFLQRCPEHTIIQCITKFIMNLFQAFIQLYFMYFLVLFMNGKIIHSRYDKASVREARITNTGKLELIYAILYPVDNLSIHESVPLFKSCTKTTKNK